MADWFVKTAGDAATKRYGPLAGAAAKLAAAKLAQTTSDYLFSGPSRPSRKRPSIDAVISATARGSKRPRTTSALPSQSHSSRRVTMPASRRRSRRRRRVATKKRRRPRRTYNKRRRKTGSTKRRIFLTNVLKPLPSVGVSHLTHRIQSSGALYNNESSGAQNSAVGLIMCTNDIIDPARTGNKDFSANGVNRLSAMYQKHRVLSYGFDVDLIYRSVLSDNAHAAIPTLYFAWRISEYEPDNRNADSGATAWREVVNQEETGWRYKKLTSSGTGSRRHHFRQKIPISKFFRYPVNTLDPSGLECSTPSTTPSTWTSPSKPCFIQFMFFYNSGVTGVVANGPLAGVDDNDVHISFQMLIKNYFYVKSDARQSDWVRQVTTTDGGEDATTIAEPAQTLTHPDPQMTNLEEDA